MKQTKPSLSRRTLFAGAATVGAVAAASTVLPGLEPSVEEPQAKAPPERGGGYQLSEHVKRYYQTTRI